ncbi:thioredoxin domain-containing protein [Porphyrobacter algicida]|uniref:Thioredoxin domain-containing protein n=1 Tax=Qipengyuania algicida TaxID=1836209 RepID=A0A845AEJ7_9SPHN|nr:DsbA family protein [Qipengyuania algicida]MXP28094.1 thioredoxin domain-containing protein [Qipengyuania algicida]
MLRNLVTALIAAVFGFAGAAAWSLTGLGDGQTRSYLMANPEILSDMAGKLQDQRNKARLAQVGPIADTPFPGAVLGNPKGTKTLVKFTDYGCTYCRASEADVQKLIRNDPNLRIVVREWPIFDGSEAAARMALAAAKQSKYAAFYRAMFKDGPPSPASIDRAAQEANLDMAQARRDAASQEVTNELAKNNALASTLGFTGTPSWIAGNQILQGAVGYRALADAISDEKSA